MSVRITTLSENTAQLGFLAEWGLSILIETDDMNILLDTGKSISVSHNADTLGIDLSKIDKIVLSHGHYDHTGGLREILRKMKKEVEIIAHPDIWAVKYSRREDQPDRYIGIPFQRQELESLGANFNLTTKPVKITDNIMTTGEIAMVTEFEKVLTRYDEYRAFFTIWAVKAHYLLGLAYEKSGWNAKAVEQYEEFLDIWKNADSGNKEIEDAKARLEALKGISSK